VKVIVSMTTITGRLGVARKAIEGILSGTMHPDEFTLNVSHDPGVLNLGIKKLPANITELPIRVHWTADHGPATKLIPTLLEHWQDDACIIVTADDDMRYPSTWLERLVSEAEKTCDNVVCYRARRVSYRGDGKPERYKHWRKLQGNHYYPPAKSVLPLGVGGVAYRPRFFRDDVFDVDTMRILTPTADDLWFAATRRQDVFARVIPGGKRVRKIRNPGPKLVSMNFHGQNDIAIAALARHYGDTPWS